MLPLGQREGHVESIHAMYRSFLTIISSAVAQLK